METQPVTERYYQAITNGKVRVVLYDDGEIVVTHVDGLPAPEYAAPPALVEKP